MPEITLFDICMSKTAYLLKECYWPLGYYSSNSYEDSNPFSSLPSHINEELVAAVVQLTPSGTLGVRHLYLVLSSGRIKSFKLEDVFLTTEEFVGILTTLSVQGRQLTKLILRKIYCVESPEEKYRTMKSKAIECLLSLSPNLEFVEIDKEFDLKVVQNIASLKHLELNFATKNKLFDLLPRLDSHFFIPNDTITYISIFEDYHNQIPVEEIAFLLQYLTKLTYITNNISGALELLHCEELFSGSLEKRYELKRYTLGNAFVSLSEGIANVSVIHIAAVTCPLTKELDLLVNDHQAVAALRDFKNLKSFLIQWEKPIAGDFRLGLRSVLECIGSQVNELSIINFCQVDFEAIGTYCPDLKALKVEYDDEVDVSDTCNVLFEHIEGLHLQCESVIGVKSETLLLVLSNCKLLTSLYLDNIRCLSDDLLDVLFSKNSLAKLKEASLTYCCISEDGLKRLINNCPLLEFLCFFSSAIAFDDVVRVVHEINPFVIVSAKI